MFGQIFWICLLDSCHLKSRTFLQNWSLITFRMLRDRRKSSHNLWNIPCLQCTVQFTSYLLCYLKWFSCGRLFPPQNICCFLSYIIKKEVQIWLQNISHSVFSSVMWPCHSLMKRWNLFLYLLGYVSALTNRIQWKWYSQPNLDLNWPGTLHFLFGTVSLRMPDAL